MTRAPRLRQVSASLLMRGRISRPRGAATGELSTKQFCMSMLRSAVRRGSNLKSVMACPRIEPERSGHDRMAPGGCHRAAAGQSGPGSKYSEGELEIPPSPQAVRPFSDPESALAEGAVRCARLVVNLLANRHFAPRQADLVEHRL